MGNTHDVPQMVSIYKKLFALLVVITLLGIGIVFLHLPLWGAVLIALGIIALKGKIVVDSFKQFLIGREALMILFGLTLVFVAGLLTLPLLNHHDRLAGTEDISKQLQMEEKPMEGHHGH